MISLLSKGPSRVFSSTTVQKHQFLGTWRGLKKTFRSPTQLTFEVESSLAHLPKKFFFFFCFQLTSINRILFFLHSGGSLLQFIVQPFINGIILPGTIKSFDLPFFFFPEQNFPSRILFHLEASICGPDIQLRLACSLSFSPGAYRPSRVQGTPAHTGSVKSL